MKDKKLNWLLTQISHLPGNHLSGTLVAYMIAPAMYKTPIRAIQPMEAWRWARVTPYAAMKWIAGTIPEHPNVRNRPDGIKNVWINRWILSNVWCKKFLPTVMSRLQRTFSTFQLFKRKGLSHKGDFKKLYGIYKKKTILSERTINYNEQFWVFLSFSVSGELSNPQS